MDYKLSREYVLSLELKKYELDGELNTWKCHMENTDGVLTEFDKEIKDYLSRESYKMKWMVGFFVVGTTGNFRSSMLQKTFFFSATRKYTVSALKFLTLTSRFDHSNCNETILKITPILEFCKMIQEKI